MVENVSKDKKCATLISHLENVVSVLMRFLRISSFSKLVMKQLLPSAYHHGKINE